jgi:hypothetical protein
VPELCSQGWQHGHAFDGGNDDRGAPLLWWQSRLELVGCRRPPAVWLMTTLAFRPLAMKHSYSAEKLAIVMAGGCLEQAGFSQRTHTPPLTMLSHVGEPREVGARGLWQLAPSRPGWLANTTKMGGGEGRGGFTAIPLRCCAPLPWQEGGR